MVAGAPDALDLTLGEVLTVWAERIPDTVAVADSSSVLTFAELESSVETLARRVAAVPEASAAVVLVQDLVGSLTGFLACRRAGRLTTVLDVTAPDAHLAGCLERLPSAVTVTSRASQERAAGIVDGPLVVLDDEDQVSNVSLPAATLDTPAVVSFTSGSTGRPKGVVHSERSSLLLQRRTVRTLGLGAGDRYGVVAPNLGATAMVAVSATVGGVGVHGFALDRGLGELPEWVATNGITVLPMTRGLVRSVAEALPEGVRLDPLRLVRIVGEPLLPGDLTAARRILPVGATFMYELGMNEAGVLAGRVIPPEEPEATRPVTVVGPIVEGVDVRIVDSDGAAAPPDEVGEIVVRGEGLALGYLGEPELTAARFTGDGSARTFTTGDTGRILADGRLEILGRTDERLKVRGFTIEPAEVEAALLSLRGVAEAAVTSAPDARGAPMLVAYVVPETGARLRSVWLRTKLAEIVAPQFVPSVFYGVGELPRTRTDKVDRAALRDVAAVALAARPGYEPPRTDLERRLARMVAEILHVDDVGRDDDIFDLGADSLDLLELFAALADDLGVAVPQQTVLEAPTVALLAARVEQHAPTAEHLAMLLGDASDAPPLFAVTGRGMPGFSFLPLARTLSAHGPWPVYAIESFDDGDRGARSLHAIAARRVAGIREVQPNGPYRLGGYSSGGLVALEIGRQLQAAGEAVDLVVLFDSGVPRSRRSAVAYERRWTRTSGPWAGASLRRRFRRARHLVYFTAGIYGLIPTWLQKRRHRAEAPGRRARQDVMVELGAVLRDGYTLEPYDGRVLYVHAMDQMREERAIGMDDAEAFGRVVTGDYSIVSVPGTHSSLLEPGSVDAVAAAVAAALGAVDARTPVVD